MAVVNEGSEHSFYSLGMILVAACITDEIACQLGYVWMLW